MIFSVTMACSPEYDSVFRARNKTIFSRDSVLSTEEEARSLISWGNVFGHFTRLLHIRCCPFYYPEFCNVSLHTWHHDRTME